MFDEHLTELAESQRSTSLLLSAAQRDLKRKLQNLMRRLAVSPSLPSLTNNCYSIVEDDIFGEKGIIEEFEIAKVVTHLSLWRADFLKMPPSLLFCSNMTVLNLSGTSIRTLPESMPESMPKLKELYLMNIHHATGTDHAKGADRRMVLPKSFSDKGFPELEILDISAGALRASDHSDTHEEFQILPHIRFFTWFKSCSELRKLYVEDYNEYYFTPDDHRDPRAFQNNRHFYKAIQSLQNLEVLSCLMTHNLRFPDNFQFSETLREFKYDDATISQVEKLSCLSSFKLLAVARLDCLDDEAKIRQIAKNKFSLEEFNGELSHNLVEVHDEIKNR